MISSKIAHSEFRAFKIVHDQICIGDSITERLRLTRGGMPLSKLPVRAIESAGLVGVHELVRTHSLMRRWGAPLLLGIGGDQTQHLLWRLANGETLLHGNGSITQKMMRRGPSVPLFSLLIGTNNLGWGMSPTETANGILGVAEHCLSHHSSARLLVTELLPRATLTPWPPDDLGGKSQQEVAMDLVRSTNSLVRRGLLHGGRFAAYRSSRRLAVADCGAHFQVAVQSWVARAKNDKGKLEFDRNTSLLPDGLHPSTAGYQLLLGCWERHLAALEAEKEEMR